jgi:hypothetical protein
MGGGDPEESTEEAGAGPALLLHGGVDADGPELDEGTQRLEHGLVQVCAPHAVVNTTRHDACVARIHTTRTAYGARHARGGMIPGPSGSGMEPPETSKEDFFWMCCSQFQT